MRISAHKLEIEKGRHNKVERERRVCKLCSLELEDELHFLISCQKLNHRRNIFDEFIINIIPEWKTLNELTQIYVIINPPTKLAVACAQFCHELLLNRNKYLPRASTSRD